MTDYVQVPREAIEILLDHYLHCYGGIHDQLALDVCAMIAAAPQATDPRDAEIERLREALDGIRIYGKDTLSGRADDPDDRAWQRDAVREMTSRAIRALTTQPSKTETRDDG